MNEDIEDSVSAAIVELAASIGRAANLLTSNGACTPEGTQLGAAEHIAMEIKEAGERIASSISDLANAIRDSHEV